MVTKFILNDNSIIVDDLDVYRTTQAKHEEISSKNPTTFINI